MLYFEFQIIPVLVIVSEGHMNKPTVTILLEQSRRTIPQPKSYSDLIKAIKKVYKGSLSHPFRIYYYDSEKDLISVTTQDDYTVACTESTAVELEFILSCDTKNSRNHMRRFTHSFGEKTSEEFREKMIQPRRTRIGNQLPLVESEVLVDNSPELPKTQKDIEHSTRNTQVEITPGGIVEENGCIMSELCDMKGELSKFLKHQIMEIIRKEVNDMVKQGIKKYMRPTHRRKNKSKFNDNTDNAGVDCCGGCTIT